MSFLKKNKKNATSSDDLKKAFNQAIAHAWTQDEAKAALMHWVDAVQRGNSIEIGNLYARGAMLWGTMADHDATGALETYRYFDMFLADKKRLEIEVKSSTVDIYGIWATVSGEYTFKYADKAGQQYVVPARYSMAIERLANGDFEIRRHHSSLHPHEPAYQVKRAP